MIESFRYKFIICVKDLLGHAGIQTTLTYLHVAQLGKPKLVETEPLMHRKCPICKKGDLVTIATFTARGPPPHWREQIKNI
uniref:hypothetical protein n=1 Tax=Marixanthomonas spongiae TaxID=2174845 RepID=UPI001F0CB074|nr:hypothetical protein [Marixanthomonas spongiae]